MVLSVIIYSCIIGMPLAYRQEFSDTLRTICIQHDLASRTRQLLRAHNTSEQCASQSFSNAACTIFHFARTFKSQVRFMHCKQTHVQIEIVHSWTSRMWIWMFFVFRRGRARNDLPWWLREIGAMTYNCNPHEWERVVTSDRRSWHISKITRRSTENYIVRNFC